MTEYQLLMAMNQISGRYLEGAQQKLGYLPQETGEPRPARSHWILGRAISMAAAVLLMSTVLFMTAFAVSQDFREFVFRFFHVEQTELVPEYTPETELAETDMFVEPEGFNTGGVIEGRYVHTPVATHARGGIYLVCTDEVEMRQGSRYDGYYEESGEFIRLEEHTFKRDYSLYGNTIHVEFDWVEHDGRVHMTWVDPEVDFRKPNESGDAHAALFQFRLTWRDSSGGMEGTWYPVLLDLHTGELTDLLAGTEAKRMRGIDNVAICPDHSGLLLGQNREDGYFLYYADLISGQLYSLDGVSGEHVDACSLTDNALICWSLRDGSYYVWKFALSTWERTELLGPVINAAATPEKDAGIVFLEGFNDINRWGDMYIGSCFALEVDEAQAVFVIDLETGERAPIEGFMWTNQVQRTPSPDGKKLLLAGMAHSGTTFDHIGVLDFGNKQYVEFSRNNENGGHEYLAYWFTHDSIIINRETDSGSLSNDFYLYCLTGPETGQQIQSMPTAQPEIPEPEDGDLVRVADYIPGIRQELRYATEDNFTGQQVYDFSEAYLRYGTVKKLAKVCDALKEQGFALRLWDGFRPLSAQEKLWEIFPDANYVSHPVTGKRTHCRGNTVDVTLVELETGMQLPMPTDYDDFTALADRDYSDCPADAAENARLLEDTMIKYGFRPLFSEWWHFTDEQDYPVEERFSPAVADGQ